MCLCCALLDILRSNPRCICNSCDMREYCISFFGLFAIHSFTLSVTRTQCEKKKRKKKKQNVIREIRTCAHFTQTDVGFCSMLRNGIRKLNGVTEMFVVWILNAFPKCQINGMSNHKHKHEHNSNLAIATNVRCLAIYPLKLFASIIQQNIICI